MSWKRNTHTSWDTTHQNCRHTERQKNKAWSRICTQSLQNRHSQDKVTWHNHRLHQSRHWKKRDISNIIKNWMYTRILNWPLSIRAGNHWIIQSRVFISLGIMSHYTMLYKYGKHMPEFLWPKKVWRIYMLRLRGEGSAMSMYLKSPLTSSTMCFSL